MVCSTCNGTGMIQSPSGLWQKCPMCEGTGQQFDPGAEFSYQIDAVLAANAQGVFTSQILNVPFRWRWPIGFSTGAYSVLVQDNRSGRQFSNEALYGPNFFGTAQNAIPLLTPWVFIQGGQIQVTLTDLSGAQNTIHLTFRGENLSQ